MPGIRTLHDSEFNIDGFAYRIDVSSVISPISSIIPSLGIDLESSIDTVSDVSLIEIGNVFHSSLFDILVERSFNLKSVNTFVNDVSIKCGVSLGVESKYNSTSEFDFSINVLNIQSSSQFKSSATALYVVPDVHTIQFGNITFRHAERNTDDKITVITEQKLANVGISEPKSYTRVITLLAETDSRYEHDYLQSVIGMRSVLYVYGIPYNNAYISNISDLQLGKGGLNRWKYTIEFTHHVLPEENVVTIGNIHLSHPVRSSPDDIRPEFFGNTDVGYNITNLVASIKRTWTFECITESKTEYDNIVSMYGVKSTLVINGETFTNAYINGTSALNPRGTGIYIYTVEICRKSGDSPITVSFAGISLPNASPNGGSVDILINKTVLHNGKTAVDIGEIPVRSFEYTCISNSRTVYDQLYNRMSDKSTLIVDGITITSKAYISSLSSPIKRGTSTNAIYTWDISFEEETA